MNPDLTALIDVGKLAHNVAVLQACCPAETELCAVVKANAYGHDVSLVAPALQDCGVRTAAVFTLAEASGLRHVGWRGDIVVLADPIATPRAEERRERIRTILDCKCEITVSSFAYVEELAKAAATAGTIAHIHLKVDSGMGRQGIATNKIVQALHDLTKHTSLGVRGVCSHFASAESHDTSLALRQLSTFRRVLHDAAPLLPVDTIRHLCNTAATLNMPEAHFDMVRCGIGLYGYAPAEHMLECYDLRPILRLASRIVQVKQLPPGHAVGYGPLVTTSRATRIGIVPIGYADGFDRRLSAFGVVGTPSGDAPILGQISMDQLTVDLTDLPAVQVGSEVTLIDENPGRPNSVRELARRLGTIPYEITCRLGERIRRVPIGRHAGTRCATPRGQCQHSQC